ncbi:MFS transporter [Luedemannella helvata]|uniref:MFS transporter n=1 Tax=Luedemannella helvata TaxID=349315 RepID=A0ABP4WTF5_9ACTN
MGMLETARRAGGCQDPSPSPGRTRAGLLARPRPFLLIATLSICGTVVSLQQTLMLPVLPGLPALLHTSVDNASWIVTATLLSGAVSIPILSRLADMFGKKRMIMVALALMVVGGVLGGLSHDLVPAIVARALQGASFVVVPIGIAIMRDELPADRVPLGVTLMSATLALGAGAALPLSGVIVAHLDWRSIFWITAVAGVASLLAIWWIVPESPVRSGGTFDYMGALLLSAAVTALLYALSKGTQWGWLSPPTLALTLIGLALLAVLVMVELRARTPLVNVVVAVRPGVMLVNIASVLCGFAMFTNMVGTMQLLQQSRDSGYGLGLDVLQAGLWMAPTGLVFGAWAPVAARIIRRFGDHAALLGGALIMAVTYVGRVFLSTELWQVVCGSVLVGIGVSMTFAAMPNLIMAAVPHTETASANGLNTLLRSVGSSMASAAVAALTTVLVVTIDGTRHPAFAAFEILFAIAAAASVVAAVVTLPLMRSGRPGAGASERAIGAEGDVHSVHGVDNRSVEGTAT